MPHVQIAHQTDKLLLAAIDLPELLPVGRVVLPEVVPAAVEILMGRAEIDKAVDEVVLVAVDLALNGTWPFLWHPLQRR